MCAYLTDRLADFALGTRFEDLPAEVVKEAKRRLLDTLGLRGRRTRRTRAEIAHRLAARIQGDPSATLIGGGQSAPDWAAFANGVHIRYLDCNDTYLSLEPGAPQRQLGRGDGGRRSGRGQRRGLDHGRGRGLRGPVPALRRGQHPRPRLGPHDLRLDLVNPGCGTAGALDHDQTVHALGIAGTTGTALRLTRAGELSMWKGCAFAFAARNAVFAAQLAALGMTGPAPLFEGEMGFIQQVSGPLDLPKLGGPLAADWMLPKTSIKFVPAEYHSQSAIAAAFELRPRDRRPPADPVDRDRHFPHGRRDHRQGPREVASRNPRDRRPQPSLLHRGRPRGRRGLGRPVHSRTLA